MSNNGLGDMTTPDARTITVEATEALSAGDAVAIDQSAADNRFPQAAQLQDDTTPDVDQEAGVVVDDDIASGDTGTIVLSGGVIANVATDVAGGERVGASATAGQLATEDDGPWLALSNEGGTDRAGTNLSANEAEVFL